MKRVDVCLATTSLLLLSFGALPSASNLVTDDAALGLPPLKAPPHNTMTAEKISLGRKLFLDPRLSKDGQFACSTCHVPEQGFALNSSATAMGLQGKALTRNAPTLLNVAYVTELFLDGREPDLESQVWGPLLNPREMANDSRDDVVVRIASLPDYAGLFENAFDGSGVSVKTLPLALASFTRSLIAGNSRFDRWMYGHDPAALSTEEQAGFRVFNWLRCPACHTFQKTFATFSDGAFHNNGAGYRPDESSSRDPGRFVITHQETDRFAFRTPSLRNVALTAPYMHDGSLATLRDVVDFYLDQARRDPLVDALVPQQTVIASERRALIVFLRALTSENISSIVNKVRAQQR